MTRKLNILRIVFSFRFFQ